MSSEESGFLVRYFSDGTYDAYRHCKPRSGEPGQEGMEIDPVWGHVLSTEPIKGTWDSSDGTRNTALSRGVRSLSGPTRKSSPWGNFSDGGLNQSIKRRLSL